MRTKALCVALLLLVNHPFTGSSPLQVFIDMQTDMMWTGRQADDTNSWREGLQAA